MAGEQLDMEDEDALTGENSPSYLPSRVGRRRKA